MYSIYHHVTSLSPGPLIIGRHLPCNLLQQQPFLLPPSFFPSSFLVLSSVIIIPIEAVLLPYPLAAYCLLRSTVEHNRQQATGNRQQATGNRQQASVEEPSRAAHVVNDSVAIPTVLCPAARRIVIVVRDEPERLQEHQRGACVAVFGIRRQ
jgi:hypothetical protein